MSRDPKANFLYYCTDELKFLIDGLKNGIWPRFCEEEISWLLQEPVVLAYPCVCFCDIPTHSNSRHRSTYGDFAVAIAKEIAGELNVNPIWYLENGSAITNHLRAQFRKGGGFDLNRLETNLRPILPYLKPTIGWQLDRDLDGAIRPQAFEQEMEWRFLPPEMSDQWLSSKRANFVSESDHLVSEPHRLRLSSDQVRAVFVPSEEDRSALQLELPGLAEKVRIW